MTMDPTRRDRFAGQPIPLTWEIPAAVSAGIVMLLAGTPLAVQGIVTYVLDGVFVWPKDRLRVALVGLLHGEFGHGIPAADYRSPVAEPRRDVGVDSGRGDHDRLCGGGCRNQVSRRGAGCAGSLWIGDSRTRV